MVWTTFKNAVERVIKKTFDLEEGRQIREKWYMVFAISCVLAVLTDPFFLYIPTINDDLKCIRLDHNLKIAALIIRSITDLVYILNIIFQLFEKGEKHYSVVVNVLLDIVAVLPIPQVTIIIYFTKLRGWRSLNIRKFLNFLVMFQYVPRIFRIYLVCKKIKVLGNRKLELWIKGGLNLLMYIVVCHIMGSLWYFFSVQRMIACWQYACRNEAGCKRVTLECHDLRTNDNIKLLNDACPVNPSDEAIFNFGIYLGALESGLVGSTDFLEKLTNCLWWGLRNLSSLGSNLEPSINKWENMFAGLTSIIGLLLFLYLIGKVQMYMQVESGILEQLRFMKEIEERNREQLRFMKEIEERNKTERKKAIEQRMVPEVERWLVENDLPDCLMTKIMKRVVEVELEENREVDNGNIESILPIELQKYITTIKEKQKEMDLWMSNKGIPRSFKRDIVNALGVELEKDGNTDFETFISGYSSTRDDLQECFPDNRLKKLKVLEILGESVLKAICEHLKPVKYGYHSVITEVDKPLKLILFVEGRIILFDDKGFNTYLDAPLVWGEELLFWPSSTSFLAVKPISNHELYTDYDDDGATGLVLTAEDMESIVSRFRPQFEQLTSHWMPRLKNLKVFEILGERVLKAICEHLKPVKYGYGSVITQVGKPLELILFVEGQINLIQDRGFYKYLDAPLVWGEELLLWPSSTSFPAVKPISNHNLSTSIHVDSTIGLVLTAEDMESIVSRFRPQFDQLTSHWMTRLKNVPQLQFMDEQVLRAIFAKLKKDSAALKYSYVENQPIASMNFIIEGSVKFTRKEFDYEEVVRGEGEFYGAELLDWVFDESFPTLTPLATHTAVYDNEVVELCITAEDLKRVATEFSSYFTKSQKKESQQPDLKTVVGMTVLKRVPKLKNLAEEVLEAMCQKLQLLNFGRNEKIIGHRMPVDKMLFVVRGKLRLLAFEYDWGREEDRFFGEELIDWLATTSNGTRPSLLSTCYKVETDYTHETVLLVITADDLEIVISNFKSHFI